MLEKKYAPIYEKPSAEFWTGRAVDSSLGKQYWYQAIQLIDLKKISAQDFLALKNQIALIGYAVDEGIDRNQGRVGASFGPNQIRSKLAKLAFHTYEPLYDFGNIVCKNGDLEKSQDTLASIISNNLNNNIFTIAIGGGHDLAYGHFKGIWQSHKNQSNKKIGIINFDAHLDLRPVISKSSSGTPFTQIFNEFNHSDLISYCIIGLQKQSNTKALLEIAAQLKVTIIEHTDCEMYKLATVIEKLQFFVNQVDMLYITIDMDGFSSAYCEGVSSPSPLGFSPNFVFSVLDFLLSSKKLVGCDIVEVNPIYDTNEMTASLAARLLDFLISAISNQEVLCS